MKIDKLTPEQESQLSVYRDKWLKIGLSTERLDRKDCEQYAEELYTQILNRKKPLVVILDSPLQTWIGTCLIACGNHDANHEDLMRDITNQLEKQQPKGSVKTNDEKHTENPAENNMSGQVVKDVISKTLMPYSSGTSWAGWNGFYDFFENVCKIKLDKKWHIWKKQANYGFMWCLENVCIMSQKPTIINMQDGVLHSDGGPSIKYADGFSCWSLNGIAVPQWLAETPAEQIDPAKIKDVDNAEVRREFVRKVGLEKIYHKLHGRIVDKKAITLKTPFDDQWECCYELVELDFGHNTKRHALVMPNASLPEMWHIEYVPTECETVEQSMNFRLNREEVDVDEQNGEMWYLHGDVVIKPKGAKKTKRWPELIA